MSLCHCVALGVRRRCLLSSFIEVCYEASPGCHAATVTLFWAITGGVSKSLQSVVPISRGFYRILFPRLLLPPLSTPVSKCFPLIMVGGRLCEKLPALFSRTPLDCTLLVRPRDRWDPINSSLIKS